jgi:ribosome-binding factor A
VPREYARHERLGNQVLRSLSELIRFESKDPRLEGVSLTGVDLSRDLSVARVYFSLLEPDQDPAPVEEALRHAAGFLRRRLGKELTVRHVPELRFRHDDSAADAMRISELIDRAVKDEDAASAADES